MKMIKKMKEKRTLTALLLAGMMIGAALFAFGGSVAAEETDQSKGFVIIEDPVDFSDVPGCESLDILTVTVSELDGERLNFTIKDNGKITSATSLPSGLHLNYMIDSTSIEITIFIYEEDSPVYPDKGIVVNNAPPDTKASAEGDTLKISTPYKSLPGIHVGSILSKSWAFTRIIAGGGGGDDGDIAPGQTHGTGYPVPEEYGKDYIVTMGPKIELTADAIEKSVKVGDEVQFSVGFKNTGPNTATVGLRADASESGWYVKFESKSLQIEAGETEYATLLVRPPPDAVEEDYTDILVTARGNSMELKVTVAKTTSNVAPPGQTLDDMDDAGGASADLDGGGTPGFGAIGLVGAVAAASLILAAGKKRRR